jgi:hypothetical protein
LYVILFHAFPYVDRQPGTHLHSQNRRQEHHEVIARPEVWNRVCPTPGRGACFFRLLTGESHSICKRFQDKHLYTEITVLHLRTITEADLLLFAGRPVATTNDEA